MQVVPVEEGATQFPAPPLGTAGRDRQEFVVQTPRKDQAPLVQVAEKKKLIHIRSFNKNRFTGQKKILPSKVPVKPVLQMGVQEFPEAVGTVQSPSTALGNAGRAVQEAAQLPVVVHPDAVQVAVKVPV